MQVGILWSEALSYNLTTTYLAEDELLLLAMYYKSFNSLRLRDIFNDIQNIIQLKNNYKNIFLHYIHYNFDTN